MIRPARTIDDGKRAIVTAMNSNKSGIHLRTLARSSLSYKGMSTEVSNIPVNVRNLPILFPDSGHTDI